MINKKSWKEFRDSGLLWFINSILHTFGWAIVVKMEDGEIIEVYPARVKFRGFSEESINKNTNNIYDYLENNIEDLKNDMKESTDK